MTKNTANSDFRKYIIPAIIVGGTSVLASVATVLAAYVGKPDKEIVYITVTPLSGTPVAQLTPSPIQTISPVQTVNSSPFNFIVLFAVAGFLLSIAILFIYYRKVSSMSKGVAQIVKPQHIESYLEERIRVKLAEQDNNATLSKGAEPERNREKLKEDLLLRGVAPYLISLLDSEMKDSYCEEIVRILHSLTIVEGETKIINLLERPNTTLQVACVNALGKFSTKNGQTMLRKILKNPTSWDKDVVNSSIMAIKNAKPRDYFKLLIELLESDNVAEPTKKSYIIPALDELNTDKARRYIKAYEISSLEGDRLEKIYARLIGQENK
jgi:hypothetical protein